MPLRSASRLWKWTYKSQHCANLFDGEWSFGLYPFKQQVFYFMCIFSYCWDCGWDRESCKSWLMCPTLEKNCWSGKTAIEHTFFSELASPWQGMLINRYNLSCRVLSLFCFFVFFSLPCPDKGSIWMWTLWIPLEVFIKPCWTQSNTATFSVEYVGLELALCSLWTQARRDLLPVP